YEKFIYYQLRLGSPPYDTLNDLDEYSSSEGPFRLRENFPRGGSGCELPLLALAIAIITTDSSGNATLLNPADTLLARLSDRSFPVEKREECQRTPNPCSCATLLRLSVWPWQ